MMRRRDVLKLLSLSALALAGGGALAACGSDTPADGDGTTSDGVRLVSADVPRVPGDDVAIPGMVAALHAAGGSLLGTVGSAQAGNLALSPYSALVAMALTTNGAAGATKDQLLGLFGGADLDTVNGGLNALTASIEALSGPVEKRDGTKTELVLDAANAIFGQAGETWEQPFLDALASQYGAGLQTVDYVSDTEAARTAINGWTAEQTHDKIPELVPPTALTQDTRMVLVNAIYLKAPWESPFSEELTEEESFTLLDGSTVDVPLMRGGATYGQYGTGDGWAAFRFDYAGREVAMTVVLPDEGRYEDVEAVVVAGGLPDLLGSLESGEAIVSLPRWTFRTQVTLVDALTALDVTDVFDPDKADLSAMTRDEPLYVSQVLQEVFIAVDEEGTEAAAATAVMAVAGSAPAQSPPEFTVDRPFLFVIHDVEHGTPLFLGRVLDPSER